MQPAEIVLAAASRGEHAAQYVALTWPLEQFAPVPDDSVFKACVCICRQGPTHSEYAAAWRALLASGGVRYRGRVYRLAKRRGAIIGALRDDGSN